MKLFLLFSMLVFAASSSFTVTAMDEVDTSVDRGILSYKFFQGASESSIREKLQTMPNITDLFFEGISLDSEGAWAAIMTQVAEQHYVTKLEVRSCDVCIEDLIVVPNLYGLKLFDLKNLCLSASDVSAFYSLTSLAIYGCSNLSSGAVSALNEGNMPHLKYLHLDNLYVRGEMIYTLRQQLPNCTVSRFS